MTISVAESEASRGVPEALEQLLQTLSTSNTVRTFSFRSLAGSVSSAPQPPRALLPADTACCVVDLHTFQAAVTGFAVLFDGYV